MGHSAAEAVVKAGLTLVPFTLTGYSAGVAVSNIGESKQVQGSIVALLLYHRQ
jgi:flagellar basal body P-ring protein FlgI